jgi:hypothetical protein
MRQTAGALVLKIAPHTRARMARTDPVLVRGRPRKEGRDAMSKNATVKRLVIATIGLAMTGPISPHGASARTTSAITGRARAAADLGCFNVDFSNGFVRNNCSGFRDFMLPLVVDSAGSKTVVAAVRAPNTAETRCRAVGTSKFGLSTSASAFVHPSTPGVAVEITMGSVSVPGGGYLFLQCEIGTSADITSANFGA